MMAAAELEQYTLETELEQSEWATLYRARRKSDDVLVIVKIVAPLYATDEFFARRFKQISGQVAELEHPNILPSYEAREENQRLYVVQDWSGARTLHDVIEAEGPFSPRRTQFIAGQIALALDFAHHNAVMHGNLSAHNIYLDQRDRVLIAEFGQAQTLYGANLARHAYTGHYPQTLAPERAAGQGPSRHADLYALGVLCYQMLTKAPPFSGPASSVLHAQAYRQPRPLSRVNAGVPLAVSDVIGRMLSKGVELRYSTGAEFARALSAACQVQKSLHAYEGLLPLAEREQGRSLSSKSLVLVSVLVVVMLVGISLAVWAGYELGIKQAVRRPLATQQGVGPPIASLDAASPSPERVRETVTGAEVRSTTVLLATVTPSRRLSISDTLLPTPDRLRPTRRPTATPTPTPSPTSRPRAAVPPPAPPAIPTEHGLLIFHNPTGHDLIIDLTGPTSGSLLIPPNSSQEIALITGRYQVIMHTPTGNFLPNRTIMFEVVEGHIIEKDYYSDFDPREFEE